MFSKREPVRTSLEKRYSTHTRSISVSTRTMIRYRQLGKIPDARSPEADDAIVAVRIRHCVDRTDDQVKNDPLKLDAIADNWTCNRSEPA